MKFYFYIKFNNDSKELYKFGVTHKLVRRLFDDHCYFSHPSEYENVFELDISDLYCLHKEPDKIISIIGRYPDYIEKLNLQYKLEWLKPLSSFLTNNIGGGTELIYKDGLETLLQFIKNDFPKMHIKPIELNKEKLKEIQDEYMKEVERNNTNNLNLILNQMSDIPPIVSPIIPNEHQQYVLDRIVTFYEDNNIGKLIWACGLGKALLGLLIIQSLNYKTVVIGVPSINLQEQMKKEIVKMYPNTDNILYVSGASNDVKNDDDESDESDDINNGELDNKIQHTTKLINIQEFMNKPSNECKFIITTYHSCHLLSNESLTFDFKIGDEAHHLVGIKHPNDSKSKRQFTAFHRINSNKTMFMTATEKSLETKSTDSGNVIQYSMDDSRHFGKLIDSKSISWAIANNKITDYNIIVLKNKEYQIDYIISQVSIDIEDKNLFLSAYMALKSIESYNSLTHILVYTNTTADADLVQNYINSILEANIILIEKDDVYNKSLHSKSLHSNDLHSKSYVNFTKEVIKFKNSKYGIIPCVYIFGEGFDLPKLNGVCISGNMNSEIRIVQYLLRPNRLDKTNPDKRSHIIIPYLDTSEKFNIENPSFEKVRTIITRMKHYDKNIEQKIKVAIPAETNNDLSIGPSGVGGGIHSDSSKVVEPYDNEFYKRNFMENGDELNGIKLRLRYSGALNCDFTVERLEYDTVKSINKSLNLNSKEEYANCEERHSLYIPNAEESFKNKGVWTNWYDFLGVDTQKFIQTKEEWKKFCKLNQITSSNYIIKCGEYVQLPLNPSNLYNNNNFTNLKDELDTKTARPRRRH